MHLEDGQGWWNTNSPAPTPSPQVANTEPCAIHTADPSKMETLPYNPESAFGSPSSTGSPTQSIADIEARIAILRMLNST